MKKDIMWWLEWTSTVVLIIGVGLTSWNIYPLNLYISFLGNILWLITAVVWRKWSLAVVEIVICIIYIIGILKVLIS